MFFLTHTEYARFAGCAGGVGRVWRASRPGAFKPHPAGRTPQTDRARMRLILPNKTSHHNSQSWRPKPSAAKPRLLRSASAHVARRSLWRTSCQAVPRSSPPGCRPGPHRPTRTARTPRTKPGSRRTAGPRPDPTNDTTSPQFGVKRPAIFLCLAGSCPPKQFKICFLAAALPEQSGCNKNGTGVSQRHGRAEANLVQLLDLWSAGWKHQGRIRAVGPGADERCHAGCGKAAQPSTIFCSHLSERIWTLWGISPANGCGLKTRKTPRLADKKSGRKLRGKWLDMHDKPVSFDAAAITWWSRTRAACALQNSVLSGLLNPAA